MVSAAAPTVSLRVVLLALLPKDGTPVAVTELARLARCTPEKIAEALLDDCLSRRVDFDERTYSYSLRREGDAL